MAPPPLSPWDKDDMDEAAFNRAMDRMLLMCACAQVAAVALLVWAFVRRFA